MFEFVPVENHPEKQIVFLLQIFIIDTFALKTVNMSIYLYEIIHQYVYENVFSGVQNKQLYNHNVDNEAFHQYVSENGLLRDQIELLYNHNVDIEAFHQYVSENGLLIDQIELLYNHNVDIETFHQYVCENGFSGY